MPKLIEIIIDKGIPLPEYSTAPKIRPEHRNYSYPYEKMQVGDSFFTTVNLSITSSTRAIRTKFIFAKRKVKGGYRIWRTY